MYLKINGQLQEVNIETVSEEELIAYFKELCALAQANPWRGKEFYEAEKVLLSLNHSTDYKALKEHFTSLKCYRQAHVADPRNKRMPTNYVEAMA